MDATAMMDMNEAILKAGRRGRLRHTAEQKRAHVEAYEASGLSFPRFRRAARGQLTDLGFQV